MRKNKIHLLFECSGTFKNEFKKLGYKTIDYDILNTYNETDNVVDLFEEIDKGFYRLNSIFDKMTSDDLVITKLVCIALERNIKLIIENPYSTQHYLINYWCIKPSLIDNDRTVLGDNYKNQQCIIL